LFFYGYRLTFYSRVEYDDLARFIPFVRSIVPCINNLDYWIIRVQTQGFSTFRSDSQLAFEENTRIDDWMRVHWKRDFRWNRDF